MTKHRLSFSKNERIKSKKEISRIFTDGIFFYSDLFAFGFIESNDKNQNFHKTAVSVPKKLFKSAVCRNKIKRQIRESYRLNKHILYKDRREKKTFYNLIFIYKSKKNEDFKKIQQNVILLLKKVSV